MTAMEILATILYRVLGFIPLCFTAAVFVFGALYIDRLKKIAGVESLRKHNPDDFTYRYMLEECHRRADNCGLAALISLATCGILWRINEIAFTCAGR